MKNHFSKVSLLFALYVALHFAEACISKNDDDCLCPDVSPFFDYRALKVGANSSSPSFGLSLLIEADSLEYLAAAPKRTDFSVMSPAWACRCLWDGHDGPKHNIQHLNIYADRDFNDTLPTGTSLNSLFFQVSGDVVRPMLPDYLPDGFWVFDSGARPIKVMTYEKPEKLAVPFVFTIEVVKTNGDTLTAETGQIYFF